MTLETRLAKTALMMERHLSACLNGPDVAGVPDRLATAMRHAVLDGGKRFRPFLVVEGAALFGAAPEVVLNAAAAVELIHCYSLVHDDLPAMDNDDLRRGRPTVHKAFDDWTAILVGDALQSLAFEILARPATVENPHVRCDLILALARAAGPAGMAGGQCLDLEAEKLGRVFEASEIRHLERLKTGALIVFACEAGAILGHAAREERQALRDYGAALGLAFQISDDLLDATGETAALGKAVGKDMQRGKATLVSTLGLAATQAALLAAEGQAKAALEPFGARADVLREAASYVSQRLF